MLRDTALNIDIHTAADTGNPCHLPLHQSLAVSEPAEPVRNGGDSFVGMVGLVHHGGFQNFVRGIQFEAMDI